MGRFRRGRAAKADRKERVAVLAEEYAKRTPKQQVALLDQRLGKGAGAVKERAQLQKRMGSIT